MSIHLLRRLLAWLRSGPTHPGARAHRHDAFFILP